MQRCVVRPTGFCLLVMAMLVVVAGSAAGAQELVDITVVVPNPSAITFYPLYTAIGAGFFEDEGLRVRVEAVDGSALVLQALAAGQAQIGAPGPGPVLNARRRGLDVVFLYNQYPQSVFGLLVPEGSPYQEPADLQGEVIGVGTADGAEVSFVRTILNDAGLVEGEDFTFLPVGDGGLAAAAFLRGEIAAYAAAVSDAAILAARGLRMREITPPAYLSYFGNGYAALGSYIREQREVIEGFGRALVRATHWSRAHKEQALEHSRRANPQEGEDRTFAAALFDAVDGRISPIVADERLGYQPPEHWRMWQESLLASGELDAPLDDLEAAYTNAFVDAWNEGEASGE